MVAHDRDRAPHDDSREDADADPHAARDQARGQVLPHPRAQPQHAEQHDRENAGDLFGREAGRRRPARDRRDDEVGHVMADEHAGKGREHEALDEHGGGGDRRRTRAERVLRAADEPAGDEQRPALDVRRAREQAQHAGREHDPRRPVPRQRPREPDDEERADAQLRDGQRRGLPDRHERQQRGRREDDAHDLPAGPDG